METEEKKWCVYIHYCKISNKSYIGITNDIKARWGNKGHKYLVKNKGGSYAHPVFAAAIKKYSDWNNDWEHIIFDDNLTEKEAQHIERILIAMFKTNVYRYGPNAGYNCTDGGEGKSGYRMSEKQIEANRERAIKQMQNPAAREHLSKLAVERNSTNEAKEKQSVMMKELWQNDDFRQKVVNNLPNRSGENHPMFGYRWSDEQRQHMSEVKKGKMCGENATFFGHHHTQEVRDLLSELAKKKVGEKNPKARKVIRLSDYKIYGYLGAAAQEANISRNAMANRCKKHKDFMYYDEWIEQQNNFSINEGG